MTDTIDEALEELKGDINGFCEEHDLEEEEAEFLLEISYNLDSISSATINGIDDLIEGIEETIKEMDTEALLFFISSGDEADLIIRIGILNQQDVKFFSLV
jgi:hypothetical protein